MLRLQRLRFQSIILEDGVLFSPLGSFLSSHAKHKQLSCYCAETLKALRILFVAYYLSFAITLLIIKSQRASRAFSPESTKCAIKIHYVDYSACTIFTVTCFLLKIKLDWPTIISNNIVALVLSSAVLFAGSSDWNYLSKTKYTFLWINAFHNLRDWKSL